jgi:hypothetical protein
MSNWNLGILWTLLNIGNKVNSNIRINYSHNSKQFNQFKAGSQFLRKMSNGPVLQVILACQNSKRSASERVFVLNHRYTTSINSASYLVLHNTIRKRQFIETIVDYLSQVIDQVLVVEFLDVVITKRHKSYQL